MCTAWQRNSGIAKLPVCDPFLFSINTFNLVKFTVHGVVSKFFKVNIWSLRKSHFYLHNLKTHR